MKRLLALAVCSLAFGVARAEDDCGKCPVSGEAANKDHSVEFKGKTVYFCCDQCPEGFKKDPAKFTAQVNHQLLHTKQITQVACPISGQPVKDEHSVDMDGCKIGFCCPNCKGKFEKASDAEKVAMAFGEKSKGFTLQTVCPVSGKAINVAKSVEFKGQKVYFCCDGCPKAFEKEPAKFEAKLPQLMK